MKVAGLGRTAWLYDAIRCVAQAGHEIVLIGTCPAAPEYAAREADFERLAGELGCPYFCDPAINRPERIADLARCGARVAISVNWLTLIGREALDAFPLGILNAHAGDLPRYRGNAAPNWALLNGEPEIAVTVHQMTTELDAGPVFLKRRLPLGERTYIGDVYRFLDEAIPGLFVQALDGLEKGVLRPEPQPSDPSTWLRCLPRLPGDGLIDWGCSASFLDRLVRASAEPFAGAFTHLEGARLTVWRGHAEPLPYPHVGAPGQVVERRRGGEVAVLTGDGLLVLEEVELASRGRRRPADVVRSTRTRLGMNLAAEIERLRTRQHPTGD